MMKRMATAIGFLAAIALIVLALCFLGIWVPNKPSGAKYPIRGIDVSHHQQEIDWQGVKASGVQFAYIKATEGADFTDGKFADNWKNSGEAGIVRGAYHFFTFGTPGQTQAANFISKVPAELNALPPAIDLEFSGYNKERRVASDEFQRELSAFWDAIFSHYHKTPVVYTTNDFQKQYLAAMPIERLWIREVWRTPREPWAFWQFSPRGRVPGIPTFVDLNVFHGTPEDFAKLSQVKEE
jgi:lysozyme